jgi:hypothetical protein
MPAGQSNVEVITSHLPCPTDQMGNTVVQAVMIEDFGTRCMGWGDRQPGPPPSGLATVSLSRAG